MTFHVGQKVICIYHVPASRRHSGFAFAEKGSVYTIRDIHSEPNRDLLLLHEVHNQMHASGMEYGFNSRGFRPIVERKTDISVFTAMLKPAGVDA